MSDSSDFSLALARFMYSKLGYSATTDSTPFSEISEKFTVYEPRYSAAGQTRWLDAAKRVFEEGDIPEDKIIEYDSNISDYLESINSNRREDISLRYYQYVAVFLSEYVLSEFSKDDSQFVREFNSYISSEFERISDENLLQLRDSSDFDKLAYWMATGSGKTFVLQINFLQVLEYFGRDSFDNAIIISPSEEVSKQHMDELEKSGIPYTDGFSDASSESVPMRVTEITKLKSGESGEKSVDIEELGQRNIIFVDEGHKGLGSDGTSESGWVAKRDYLTNDGFAFEYSATFASSLSGDKYQEYSRSILFDYPYGHFHSDGYGKDYNITNVSSSNENVDYIQDEQDKWLLANLVSYYEKLCLYEEESAVVDEHNIEMPLSVFIGNNVNAKNKSGKTDIQTVVEFISSIVSNDDWVRPTLQDILDESGLFSESGIFGERFSHIRGSMTHADELYEDLLKRLVGDSSASELEAVRLKNLEDEEIGLSTDVTETYFGVITIGDTPEFHSLLEEADNRVRIRTNEVHSNSLFGQIDSEDSQVRVLIGSKKFAEGWDSTRPSTMGLLNIGRNEGPMVVQMFGRGVRVTGQSGDGKRADVDTVSDSSRLPVKRLETLDVFGVRADYIEEFRDHLQKERIDVSDTAVVSVDVERESSEKYTSLRVPQFVDVQKEELVPILRLRDSFDGDILNQKLGIELDSDGRVSLESDVFPAKKIQTKGSRVTADTDSSYESQVSPISIVDDLSLYSGDGSVPVSLDILDWDRIWSDCIQYKNESGYSEILIEKSDVRDIIEFEYYDELRADAGLVQLTSLERSELSRVESLCSHLISKYLDNLYSVMLDSATEEEVQLEPITGAWLDDRTPDKYEVSIRNPEENKDLIRSLESIEGGHSSVFFRELNQLYRPVLLDAETLGDEYEEKIGSVTPEGIDNVGEKRFLDSLESHIRDGCLSEYEVLIMRNQANTGVRVPEGSGETYPDFVIWVTKNGVQHIILADPHGMVLGGGQFELDSLKRVNESVGVGTEDVELHYCKFARSFGDGFVGTRETIKEKYGIDSLSENHLFLVDDEAPDSEGGLTGEQVEKMIEKYIQ